jgi:hypothetical protein
VRERERFESGRSERESERRRPEKEWWTESERENCRKREEIGSESERDEIGER